MTDSTDQPGGNTGLLDTVTVEDSTKPTDSASAAQIDHKAPADGATTATDTGAPKTRPEYLPENFWNSDKGEPNLEAMAKSYTDLRKLVSQGKHKAPEDGKYDTSALGIENIEADPMSKYYVDWAQKWGIPQGAFDELANQVKTLGAEPEVDTAAEMQALGPNANAVINGMVDWARGLVNKGVWSKDDFEEFKFMGGTARGLRALMKIREAYEGRIPIESSPQDGAPSKEELYAMVADPKYQSDAAYRQKVERLFQQYAG